MPASGAAVGGDQGAWSQLQPATSPSTRFWHGMAYDGARGQAVVFGGKDSISGNNYLSDTWTWDGTTWKKRTPLVRPPRRILPSMAYDAARKQVVMFGGHDFYGGMLGDTWTWDGTNWTKHTPPVSPAPRVSAAMAYDAARQKVVLFSGEGLSASAEKLYDFVTDTWTWDGATWTLESPAVSPPPRFDSDMTYDSASQRLVVFGGVVPDGPDSDLSNSKLSNDTWTWDGKNWTEHHPSLLGKSPTPRNYHSLSYDVGTDQVVMFGGTIDKRIGLSDYWTTEALNDTWTWDGTDWTLRSPSESPPSRWAHRMLYVPGIKKHLLFGGGDAVTGPSNQTWTYELGGAKPLIDFNGDSTTDVAIFRPSSGQWFARGNPAYPVTYGTQKGDVPLAGDYNGDGSTDVGIFRAGTWLVRDQFSVTFGTKDGDIPVPGDYDGNGSTDVAIYRPGSGTWFVRGNPAFPVTFGTKLGDVPVPADYDGNGTTDVAIFRPSTGQWFVRSNPAFPVTFGTQLGDVPVPADYDGDRGTDVAIFRDGTWHVRNNNELGVHSGVAYGTQDGDVPVPADYDGNGAADIAIFRSGQWFVRGNAAFPVSYGTKTGDVPLQVPYAIRSAFPPPPPSS